MGDVCTNLRIANSSFALSKLRICSLAWHKNPLTNHLKILFVASWVSLHQFVSYKFLICWCGSGKKTQISERILGGAVTALLCWWCSRKFREKLKTQITRWMQGRGVTPLLCWEFSRNFQKKLKTQITGWMQGIRENGFRSLLNANEEAVYRSITQQTLVICVF